MEPVHLRFGGYQPPTSVQNDIVRLTDTERTLFVEAVAPVLDEQRKAFGNQLFAYLE